MQVLKSLKLLFTATLLISGLVHADAPPAQPQYTLLSTPQPTANRAKIEVIEFFWYGCPHCYHLEPQLENWASHLPPDVDFKRVHVAWGDAQEKHGQIFYALEAAGLTNRLHKAVFDTVQGGNGAERLELRDPDVLKTWVKQHGVDGNHFMDLYNSFGVIAQAKNAKQLGEDYQIDGVPTFIVQGKYKTSPSMINDEEGHVFFNVLDSIIAKERAAMKKAPAKGKGKAKK